MELETPHEIRDEQHLWTELEAIASRECDTSDLIDDTLRTFLLLTTTHRDEYVHSEFEIARCSFLLLCGSLFEKHEDYVRRQMIHCLLQDDDVDVQAFATSFLLLDVRETESTAEFLNEEGVFPRLVDLITDPIQAEDAVLHRLLMELLYEMSRIQCIKRDDLLHISDAFICRLFELIEELSVDASDPYHYHIIRVLLVLNEQYMVSAHAPGVATTSGVNLTNKIIKVLSSKGSRYKIFGENIILLLNRESETSLQLLTLKLLYLLFTTPSTQEYFYTNDLRVLVDILIRNLLDLPSESVSLRHTYLRVLYPLLAHTQLKSPPHYKSDELKKLLAVLAGDQTVNDSIGQEDPRALISGHFEKIDETTIRLVARCRSVIWLMDAEEEQILGQIAVTSDMPISPVDSVSSDKVPPVPPLSRKLRKRGSTSSSPTFLAPNLESARESALSMVEVAAQREKPGVITPSKRASLLAAKLGPEKGRPPLPKARRSAWSRLSKPTATTPAPVEYDSIEDRLGKGDLNLNLSAHARGAEQTQKPPSPKKAPPAPKARRWPGKRRSKADEGGGNEGASSQLETMRQTRSLISPSEHINHPGEQEEQNISVQEALSNVHDEAMESINETMKTVGLDPTLDPERKMILTPPSPAPPRGVPGPVVNLERSPFIDDSEGE